MRLLFKRQLISHSKINEIIILLFRYIPEGVEVCVTTTERTFEEGGREEEVETTEMQPEPSASASSSSVYYYEEEYEEDDNDTSNVYTCEMCGLSLCRESTMEMHKQQVHVEEALYACEFCSDTAIHWSEYYTHQCTNPDMAPLQCPNCQETVSTKKQLQVHEEIHALQRRFTTKKMDSYFARKLEEAEDPVTDWGLKPFLCGVCGKPFGKMYEVEYHEKLHNHERVPPNPCPKECGMRYINKNDLNKHVARGCSNELYRTTVHRK